MKILVSKNGMCIYPYKSGDCQILERRTSIYDHVYKKYNEVSGFLVPHRNKVKCFVTTKQQERYMSSLLPDAEYLKMHFNYSKKMGQEFKLNPDIILSDLQGHVSLEVLQSLDNYNEWFMNLPTGSGKTLLSVYLTSIFKVRTLVVCFSVKILEQWRTTYEEKTTADTSRIHTIKSVKFFDNIPADDYDIYLITPTILLNLINSKGGSELFNIFDELGIGLIIYDEAHRHTGTMTKMNALTNIKYTIYASADYTQANQQLEAQFFNIFNSAKIITVPEEYQKSFKYTTAIIYQYNTNPSEKDELGIRNRYGYDTNRYMNYQFEKGVIYDVLVDIMNQVIKSRSSCTIPGVKTIFLIPNVKHVELAYEHLKESFPSERIVAYHGQSEVRLHDREMEEADVIVATYKSFGTGIDVENIKYVVGLNQSNKIEDNQAAGRARALKDGSNAFYFMVMDSGFDYCSLKLKSRINYLVDQKLGNMPILYKYTNNQNFDI